MNLRDALLLLVLLTGSGHALARPNVLFIAVDDLRPELGCYGAAQVKTPRLDELAAGGLTFTRAYCQQAVCNPSRASLLTGMRPDSTRVWDLVAHFRDLTPDVTTLPQHFKNRGYYAAAVGKIFHNPLPDRISWNEPNHWPEQSETWSAEGRRRLAEYRQQMRAEGKPAALVRRMRAPATDDEEVADDARPDGKIANQAIEILRRLAPQDQPFFLAVGFIRPHLPFTPPRKYWQLYDRSQLALAGTAIPQGAPAMAMNTMYELRDYLDFAGTPGPTEGALTEDQQRLLRHGYFASVSYVDAQIGRLLDALDESGERDETIVVVWGDHGWKLGELNSWCKQTNYEVDARVPLILRAPGGPQGQSSDALVELIDLYPTLCELAGLPTPAHAEGKSMTPLLKNPQQRWKQAAFSQFRRLHEGRDYMGYAMRTTGFRYVEWLDRQTGDVAARELYDHAAELDTTTNLADDPHRQSMVAELSETLWRSLKRPLPLPTAAPHPVRESQLPKVLLIGDSIRLGYAPEVGRLLTAKATVASPLANGSDSRTVLARMDSWIAGKPPALVLFNCGIHDVKKSKTNGGFQVPPDEYRANLRKIVAELRDRTKAQVAFVTTTPVIDDRAASHRKDRDYELLNASVEQFNDIARRVMDELQVPVLDLHAAISADNPAARIGPDGVHPTADGTSLLAERIVPFVAEHLPQSPLENPAAR